MTHQIAVENTRQEDTKITTPGESQSTRLDLTEILDEVVDWRYKSFPPTGQEVTIGSIGEQEWDALGGDLLFPVMLLKESALEHNIALMARYCREHGVSLAPHGKTPMAPQIVQRQLDVGAWGITAATLHQVRVFRAVGVSRIVLANELLEPVALRWLSSELDRDPGFDFLCLVDSEEQIAAMTRVLNQIDGTRPIDVLVELGAPAGRAGCRTIEEAERVARAVEESPHLQLAGVEGYEGVIKGSSLDETIANVDDYMRRLRDLTTVLARSGRFAERSEIIVTAGGSLFFDRVVEVLAQPWGLSLPVRVVLRSGSYVTHDADSHERLSPLAGRATGPDRLRPALELWATVLSRPEPELAIIGFGKRDAPYDLNLPIPFAVRRSGASSPIEGEAVVTALNDQHAFLRVEPGSDLAVGDLVALNISHPCTTFDKWRLVPLVDDAYRVTGAIRTFF